MRLKQRLEKSDYLVFRFDIRDYINTSMPVDISDFLMTISGGFSDAIVQSGCLGDQLSHEHYWDRLIGFLKKIKVEDLSVALDAGVVSIQSNLKSDPSFRQLLQERMTGHLGALVNDVREFFEICINALKKRHGNDREIVLLVDSFEHFRGTLANAQAVQGSVEGLFVSHSERLHLPHLHVVYTVPPYLKVRYSNLGSLYEPGGVHVLPAFKLQKKDGTYLQEGYDAMERVVGARGDWERLLGGRSALDRLIQYSGGHLRDLLRLMAEVLRRARDLPVPENTVTAAIDQLRTEFLPIADADARWLAEIARTHQTALESTENLPDLARFFDTHLALCYRNGDEWYDVHPLISEHVTSQAEEARRRG